MVIDMIMDPGMNGLKTFQEVKKTRPDQKAIIASGFSETKRVTTALEPGAGAYLRKPYSLEQIGLPVKEILEQSQDKNSFQFLDTIPPSGLSYPRSSLSILFWLFSYIKQFSFAGDVPTQAIALFIAVLILVVFGISFVIEKTIDLFLGLLGLGPVVFIVAAVALTQGLLTGLHITDHHGLLNLLRG